jgi:apolipoprotein N-acyltransferase
MLGAAIAGVWWLRVDARTCLGGSCNGTPPGDLTVYIGALGGAALGLVVWLFWRFTRRGAVRRISARQRDLELTRFGGHPDLGR